MELFKLFGTIAINSDGANETIDKVVQKAEGAGSSFAAMGGKLSDAGDKMSSMGKKLSLGVTAPLVTLGGVAIKTTADFEASMSEVSAISGATGEDFQRLEKLAREMGKTTKFSASESAEALKYMAMAGWKTEDMLDGLEGVMNLAAASGEDLGTTSDIVTDALTAFGMSASESGHFADILATASSNANTNVGMMGETFKYVAPVAGALGYSAEDVSLAIGLMANASIKSSQAGTSLRSSLTRLSGTNEAVMNTMVSLGLATAETAEVFDDGRIEKAQTKVANKTIDMEKAQIKYNDAVSKYGENSSQAQTAALNLEKAENNLQGALNELETAYQGNIEVQGYNNDLMFRSDGTSRALRDVIIDLREKFSTLSEEEQLNAAAVLFGQEAMSGMLAVINASDEDFSKLTESIDSSDGAAKEMADTMNNNLSGQLTLLKSQLGELAIQFVTLIMPYLKQGVEWLSGACDWVAGLDDNTKKMIFTIGGIVAAVGPVLKILGSCSSAIGGIITIGGKLAGGIGNIIKIGGGLVSGVSKVAGAFSGIASFATGTLIPAIGAIGTPVLAVIGVITALVAAGVALYQNWDTICEWAGKAWGAIKETVGGAIDGIKGFFGDLKDRVSEKFHEMTEAVSGKAAELKEKVTAKFSELKEAAVEKFTALKEAAVNKFHELKDSAGEKIKEFTRQGAEKFAELKSAVEEKVSSLKEAAVNKFHELKEGAGEKIRELTREGAEKFAELKGAVEEKVTALKEAAVSKFHELKDGAAEKIKELTREGAEKFAELKGTVDEKVSAIKEAAVSKFRELKDGAGEKIKELTREGAEKFAELKGTVDEKVSALKEGAVNKFNELKDGAMDRISSLRDRAMDAFSNLWERGLDGFEGLKSGALEKFAALGSGIQDKLEGVKNFVSDCVGKLKDFFRFDWELPKIKLPHFSISGSFSLNPPSIPSFGIDWYKEGGIMTDPTVFGRNPGTGNAMVGGEAGPEAIAPIELLKEYVREAVAEGDSRLYDVLEAIRALLAEYLPRLSELQLVLDTGTLVGETAPAMNAELGRIKHMRGRRN